MGKAEERIAEFIVATPSHEVPATALAAAHRSTLDAVGCMLASAPEPHGRTIARLAEREGGGVQHATVIGAGIGTSRTSAALANGTLAHGLDYDDGRTGAGHAAGMILPTLLALGEPRGASGAELLVAYAIGLEVVTHISDASVYEEKDAGFHRTSIFGVLAATAAGARLVGLDRGQTVAALGIAGSMASGICQNFGTYTKPLHSGLVSRSAVTATLLAAEGWTATPDILGGPLGWAEAYLQHFDYDAMARDLGGPWRTAERIPLIKKYPCCGLSHGPLDALLGLMAEEGFGLADVAELEAWATHDSVVMIYPRPASGHQGRFSLPYTLATALIDGRIDLDSFTDEKLHRPAYAEAIGRIRINLTSKWDDHRSASDRRRRFKRDDALPITVRLQDGRTLTRSVQRVEGLLTPEEVEAKFRDAASRALPASGVETALGLWRRLDALTDIREAVGAVRGAGVH